METSNAGHWSLASAVKLTGRQFLEFAEWQSLESQHLSPSFNLEIREGSVSVFGVYSEGSMLLSASLHFPAGAGVRTTSVVDVYTGH